MQPLDDEKPIKNTQIKPMGAGGVRDHSGLIKVEDVDNVHTRNEVTIHEALEA